MNSVFPTPHSFFSNNIIFILFFLSISYSQNTLGDLNQDESVDILDIVRTVNIILEVPPEPSDYELWAGDVNVDEIINVLDVVVESLFILNQLSCPESNHPCEFNYSECCTDTPNHEFSWEVDTIGTRNPSILFDVDFINQNDIVVVGDIKMPNPEFPDDINSSLSFNYAHWNGDEWSFYKTDDGPAPLISIKYFNENNIWVSSGIPKHWDGENWTSYHLWNMNILSYPEDGPVYHIWASSPDNIYFIGDNGTIVHFDGLGFVRMESGTDVHLKDIHGLPDGSKVFVVGWDSNFPAPTIALELINDSWDTLYYKEGSIAEDGDYGWIHGVGVLGDTVYFTTEAGLWKYNYLNESSILIPENECQFYENAISSVGIQFTNDIIFSGRNFGFVHFNGLAYDYNTEIPEHFSYTCHNSTSIYKDNLLLIPGYYEIFEFTWKFYGLFGRINKNE